ncbi:uncharacterized protein LOC115064014 [Mus pahari]|uniref:uncharacterized protein LOC115064014 n=1 Tax=Mus pahari TaxID=10093 RepID=UPI001114CCA8|nr:uncharacterized protein LOC115064014 [Mus pahari]
MGQTQTTPLSLFLDHFKDYKKRARSRGLVVKKKRLTAFCRKEWPTFNVGWPPGGTWNLPAIFRTKDIIFRPPGHPEQVPYIITWLDLVQDPPKWLKPWLPPPQPSAILLAPENREEPKTESNPRVPLYPVLQGNTEEDFLVSYPPYRPPSGGSPGPQPEAPGEAHGSPLVTPPHTQGKAQPELPQPPVAKSTVLPLRAIGPQDDEGNQLMEYCPLAITQLYNWKCKYPQFSEKPAALINLIDSVILTHQPTWDDCQLLLQILFTTEERERILIEAMKLVPGANGSPATKQALIDSGFYGTRPDWNFNSEEGKESLRVYRQTLMRGLRAAAQGPTHLAKVRRVHQEMAESPTFFLERIMEAYRTYTSLDPAAPENKSAVIMTFVDQAVPDIKHKLQRIDRLGEKSLQELLVVAEEVVDNREILKKKHLEAYEELGNQRLATTLVSLSADSPEEKDRQLRQCADGKGKRPQQKGKPKLQKNQCAYCKKMGHWVKNCPKKPPKRDKGGQGLDPLSEPKVTHKVEGKLVSFLGDTGAQYSVQTHGKLSSKKSWEPGATGMDQDAWTTRRRVNLRTGQVSHSMTIPNCPNSPLGRNLPTKIGAQISFDRKGNSVTDSRGCPSHILPLPLEDELDERPSSFPDEISTWLARFPSAWAETKGMGLVSHRAPIRVELKPKATPVRIRQYPISQEAKSGVTPHIRRFRDLGILVPCQSPWNTPLHPIKKHNSNDYRLVQNLKEVNKRVMDIDFTVPNQYTILSSLKPSQTWYTVLDLKDAVLSLPLAPQSQPLFAFEWHDPEEEFNGQLTWTRLPQGFKNSTAIFYKALHEDLGEYRREHPNTTLLQYVDDLLVAAETMEECQQSTEDLLMALGQLGYRASAKKAQICQQEVTYLGNVLKGGQQWLSEARKDTILKIPTPTTTQKVRQFLGSAGFCRLWVPNFAELAKPLYEATKKGEPFQWTKAQESSFNGLKQALLAAPPLALPDITKPFHLYIDESKGIAKGVLTQMLGSWIRPVAYLSKKLDPVASGWPPCLRIINATALLVKDADKLTLGQELCITTPHAIEAVLKQPPDRWVSNAHMTRYQSLLLNPERIHFLPSAALNPDSLLPDPDLETPVHDCVGILSQVHRVGKDLTAECRSHLVHGQ